MPACWAKLNDPNYNRVHRPKQLSSLLYPECGGLFQLSDHQALALAVRLKISLIDCQLVKVAAIAYAALYPPYRLFALKGQSRQSRAQISADPIPTLLLRRRV